MSEYHFLYPYVFKNGLRVNNRIVMPPMTTKSSFYNGMITTDEHAYYAARAGGPGIIVTGAANVSARGKGFPGALSIAADGMIPELLRLSTAVKARGSKLVVQLFHAGAKTVPALLDGKLPLAPSKLADHSVEVLDDAQIETIVADFAAAAKRAIASGFNGVEIHGDGGFLLQQFFSPKTNQRPDQWGGSIENRTRLALMIVERVREVIDNAEMRRPFLLGFRFAPEETNGGFTLADTLQLVELLREKVDYLHLSMSDFKAQSETSHEDQLTLSALAAVKGETPLIAVGGIKTPAQAQEALALGADFASLGKELIREPQWVQKIAYGDEDSLRTTISPCDFEELAIPPVMQSYLVTQFKQTMGFTRLED